MMDIGQFIYNNSPPIIQTVLLNIKAGQLYRDRYGKKFWKLFDQFCENEWEDQEKIYEMQFSRLQLIIKFAYETVPYYKNKFDIHKFNPADLRKQSDIQKIPILTKEDIKENFDNLISKKIPRRLLRYGHTSGTTGSPLKIAYDINTCVVHHVADWRQKQWAGLTYGQPYASLQGRVIVPLAQDKPPFWRKNYINNQLFLSAFHLNEKNIPFYFEKMAEDKIQYLEGYPSNIYILALYLEKKGATFPLRAVLTSSETLYAFQRELIEKTFSCKIFDFYGMAERVVFASECDCHCGRHLNSDYGITEFLSDGGVPVKTGEVGNIVGTGLHNFAMPLIRYKTNDACRVLDKKCACGRVLPLMDSVTTKKESIITLPDGTLLSPSVLTHPFKPMQNILESQIVQESMSELSIKLVVNELFGKNEEKILVDRFRERVGSDINIKIIYVDKVEKTNSGKLKWVISKIKPKI